MAKRKDNLYSWEHQRRVQYDQKLKDEQFFKDKARYEEKKARASIKRDANITSNDCSKDYRLLYRISNHHIFYSVS